MATSAEILQGLSVDPAAPGEMPVIANLVQLYVYDFEPFIDGRVEGEILPNGRYPEERHLAAYWREEGRFPYLLRVHGVVAGFALVNRHFKLPAPCDWSIGEFFVHRRFRKLGVGRVVAHRLFTRHPGLWEVAVMRSNLPAKAFWPKAVAGCPGVVRIAVQDGGASWNGPVMRFEVRL